MSDELREKVAQAMEELRSYINKTVSVDILQQISAEDIAQETYVRATEQLERFEYRDERRFVAWLRRIARNIALSAVRKRRPPSYDPLTQAFIDSGILTPSGIARKAEAEVGVQEAVCQLKPIHREILQLRYVEDLSFVQIAERIALSDASVRGRHRNALRALTTDLLGHQ